MGSGGEVVTSPPLNRKLGSSRPTMVCRCLLLEVEAKHYQAQKKLECRSSAEAQQRFIFWAFPLCINRLIIKQPCIQKNTCFSQNPSKQTTAATKISNKQLLQQKFQLLQQKLKNIKRFLYITYSLNLHSLFSGSRKHYQEHESKQLYKVLSEKREISLELVKIRQGLGFDLSPTYCELEKKILTHKITNNSHK